MNLQVKRKDIVKYNTLLEKPVIYVLPLDKDWNNIPREY